VINLAKKESANFEKYVELRIKVRDTHYLQWELLNEKMLELIEKTEQVTPDIIDDIKIAYDYLIQGIIPSIFPTDFPTPKNFNDLQEKELSLLDTIPEALRKMFNKLFKAYLKNSVNNPLLPDDTLFKLLTRFNNENAEFRYPNQTTNPYLDRRYVGTRNPNYIWQKKVADEYYPYYDGVLTLLSSIRNFQTHKEDAFTSSHFELAKRKVAEPISGVKNPGNYVVLSNLVILCVYLFIEILQIWLDTQVRIGRI